MIDDMADAEDMRNALDAEALNAARAMGNINRGPSDVDEERLAAEQILVEELRAEVGYDDVNLAWNAEARRQAEERRREQERLRQMNAVNNPSNWTDDQRRVAGLASQPVIPQAPPPRQRPASEVEAERANRFRQTAELERAMRIAQKAADVLQEAEQVLAAAKAMARELENESKIKEAEDLEFKLQQIEDSIDQAGG